MPLLFFTIYLASWRRDVGTKLQRRRALSRLFLLMIVERIEQLARNTVVDLCCILQCHRIADNRFEAITRKNQPGSGMKLRSRCRPECALELAALAFNVVLVIGKYLVHDFREI